MRKFFALLLALVLLVSVMTVPAFALLDVGDGGGGDTGGGNTGGGSSGPVVGEGTQKEFGGTGDPTEGTGDPAEETSDPTEGTGDPAEETGDPTEGTGDPTEGTGDPTEGTGDPNEGTNISNGENTNHELNEVNDSVPLLPTDREPVEEAGDASEMILLVALITGLGAICVVLLIRRFLDL